MGYEKLESRRLTMSTFNASSIEQITSCGKEIHSHEPRLLLKLILYILMAAGIYTLVC